MQRRNIAVVRRNVQNPSGAAPAPPAAEPMLDAIVTAGGVMARAYWSAASRGSAGYAGPLVEVRRSSDNALADIGVDANGNLDEVALIAHVGVVGNGFVRTFYDHTGNGNHVVQATAGSQLQIVTAGAIAKRGTLVAGTYVLGNFTSYSRADACGWSGSAQDITLYALGQLSIVRGSNQSMLQVGASTDGQRFIFSAYATTNLPFLGMTGANGRTFAGTALSTLSTVIAGKAASANLWTSLCEQNGVSATPTNQGAGGVPNVTATLTRLGADGGGVNRWEGTLPEVAIWEDDMIGDAGAPLTALRAAAAAQLVKAT